MNEKNNEIAKTILQIKLGEAVIQLMKKTGVSKDEAIKLLAELVS